MKKNYLQNMRQCAKNWRRNLATRPDALLIIAYWLAKAVVWRERAKNLTLESPCI